MAGKVSLGLVIVVMLGCMIPLSTFGFRCETTQVTVPGLEMPRAGIPRYAKSFLRLAQAQVVRPQAVTPVPGPLPAAGDSPRTPPPFLSVSGAPDTSRPRVPSFSLTNFALSLVGKGKTPQTKTAAGFVPPPGYVPMVPPVSSLQHVSSRHRGSRHR